MATRAFLRLLVLASFIAFGAARGAQLDLTADAVLGRPDFLTSSPPISASAMSNPTYVAEDSVTGELWVVDPGAHRVLRFASAAAFTNGQSANLVLGQAGFTAPLANRGGAAAANTMASPAGVAVDNGGRVFVSDFGNNRVLVFRAPFSTGMNASLVLGQADLLSTASNRGGAVAANTLSGPLGVALDVNGNVYVADALNNRVLRYNAPIASGEAAAKVYGQGMPGSMSTNAPSLSATGMAWPSGVALDGGDNLWVADHDNNRVLRFNIVAGTTDEQADFVLCQATFVTNAQGTTASTCRSPAGVTVDLDGNIYVADGGNHRVLRFTSLGNGTSATAVAGQVSMTAGTCNQGGTANENRLCNPWSLMLDRLGNLIVADDGNGRVLRFDVPHPRPAPGMQMISPAYVPIGFAPFVLSVSGTGFVKDSVVNLAGAPKPTTFISDSRLLANITAGEVSSPGPLPVTVTTPAPGGGTSGSFGLQTYAMSGFDNVADRVLGQPSFATSSLGLDTGGRNVAGVSAAVLQGPIDAVVDSFGRVFVSDYAGHRILSWPNIALMNNAQAADVILGQPDEVTALCNQGNAAPSATSVCYPDQIAVDTLTGGLYVVDRGNNRVLFYPAPFSTGMAATRVYGQAGSFTSNTSNNGGISGSSLSVPNGIVFRGGLLFVYDSGNRRILGYADPAHNPAAIVAVGQPNLTSAVTEVASATRFGGNGHIAMDSTGHLYLSTGSLQNRVLRFSPPYSSNMSASAVLGQADFNSTSGGLSATAFNAPYGLAFDAADRLYVADADNHRVLRFDLPNTTGMAASAVLGQTSYTTNTSGTTAAKFWTPYGVATFNQADVFVGDFNNARVLAFNAPVLAPTPLTVNKAGAGSGMVSSSPMGILCGPTCTANFAPGVVVTLTASASPGSTFTGWSGGGCSGTSSCQVTMNAPVTVTATFNPPSASLTVGKTGTGSGTIASSPAGIDCGATCASTFPYGSGVTLTATAAPGSLFTGWAGGGCSGTGVCSVTLNGDASVSASFTAMNTLTVAKSGSGSGAVTSSPAGIDCGATCSAPFASGTNVTLTATPSAGSVFSGWSGACTGTGTCSVTMNASASVTATFDPPTRSIGISTRMRVLNGDNVLIGGFIIGGSTPKKVVINARGPSLASQGVSGALVNPVLQLVASNGTVTTNDDWGSAPYAGELSSLGLAPPNPLESSILATLDPGAYTAIVSGVGGATGVGIVEVFEVDHPESPLTGISTRGRVMTADNVMIGGFIISGVTPQTVVVRARGPSLASQGVADPLLNPVLQLVFPNGTVVSNDDWQTAGNAGTLQSMGYAPADPRESALLITLDPGAYTAIVSGVGGTMGVGIVEVYTP